MSQPIYESLLQVLAERLSVDAAELISSGVLEIDGVAIQLQCRETESEPFVLMIVHFGEIPWRGRDAAARRLLEVNLDLVDSELCTYFAIDPATGEVVLCIRAMLLDLSVDYLQSAISAVVGQAASWRRGEYDLGA